jgi:hypothetical protein
MVREFLKSREEIAAKKEEQKEKRQFLRPQVDISALRQSISQSMGKGGEPKVENRKLNVEADATKVGNVEAVAGRPSSAEVAPTKPAFIQAPSGRPVATEALAAKPTSAAANTVTKPSFAEAAMEAKSAFVQVAPGKPVSTAAATVGKPVSTAAATVGKQEASEKAQGSAEAGNMGGGLAARKEEPPLTPPRRPQADPPPAEKGGGRDQVVPKQPGVLTLRELKEKSMERERRGDGRGRNYEARGVIGNQGNENKIQKDEVVKSGLIANGEEKATPSDLHLLEEQVRSRPKTN